MENTRFNGVFILICRQQHFETFLFKWNGRLLTIQNVLYIHFFCAASLLLFSSIRSKQNKTENKQSGLQMWIDFLVSSKDMKSQVNEKKIWKIFSPEAILSENLFQCEKVHTQNKTQEALINLPQKRQ